MKEGVKMIKAGIKFEDIEKKLMRDEEFAAEYEKLKPRYELIAQIIDARNQLNITQEELAQRVGTQKSNISRFESGSYNPSLDFITKIARGLGKDVHIKID
jgi:DNA-binding XRE family transcriptional regulator